MSIVSDPVSQSPNILAIIPARSGSKSIIDKNIRSVRGKPLLAYSIEHALDSKMVTRTIVSTDSEYYAAIARSFGAEVPFLRPSAISGDLSTDLELFEHALNWLKINECYTPDLVVHLRPTTPIRKIADLDSMINMLLKNPGADSIRSLVRNKETPYKMWFMDSSGMIKPVVSDPGIKEAYNLPRQMLPPTYLQNASIDVIRARTILELKSMTGNCILGYEMEENWDIDFDHQLEFAGNSLESFGEERKTFVFDIDGVIAHLSPYNQYDLAEPNREVIRKINKLYKDGHHIVLFTARGSKTGINWREITEKQMEKWQVNYHELHFNKPFADYYIDDRLISINDILNFKD